MKHVFVGLLLLFSGGLYAADSFLPPFTATYGLYAKGWSVGEGTRTLTHQGDNKWVFETHAGSTGFLSLFKDIRIDERSEFRLVNGQVLPSKYTYRQTGHKDRYSRISFNWYRKKATSLYKGETKVIPLEEGTLDRLVYQVVLMQDLKQGKRRLKYKIANKGKIRVYRPKFIGRESVNTGIGQLETVKYERQSSNSKRRTTLWCASNLHYLPVQVEHVEKDGDVFRLELQSVRWHKIQ
ncbi:MAG: hypothetical protein DRR08_25670 [Candidatus Parabeggiatoa sp. nov. 2]|nr:MAG: hypothetical protein B6247_05570 [Beggiatoa sp. 4572_84]RKZ54925.1 MAG: hypothetical protein DRR08_25670 [Gammaproteobacteria bacterium]